MDAQDILKSLNNLEKSLQNVESARQQVTETVNAYESTRSQLQTLSDEFSSISSELKGIYKTINDNQEDINGCLKTNIEEVFSKINAKISGLSVATLKIQSSFGDICTKSAKTISDSVDESVTKFNSTIDESISRFNQKASLDVDAILKIQSSFSETCTESAQTVSNSVDESVTKFNSSIDESISRFRQKASLEIDAIAKALEGFQSASETLLSSFKNSIDNSISTQLTAQNDMVTNVQSTLIHHISALKTLESELHAILHEYKENSKKILDKIGNEISSVKLEFPQITDSISKLQSDIDARFNDIVTKLSSVRETVVNNVLSSSNNLYERFNKVDSSMSGLADRLDRASTCVIRTNKESLSKTEEKIWLELESLKEDLASSKKIVLICLIVLAISILLNIFILVK